MRSFKKRMYLTPLGIVLIFAVSVLGVFGILGGVFIDKQVRASIDSFVEYNISKDNLIDKSKSISPKDKAGRFKIEKERKVVEDRYKDSPTTVAIQTIPMDFDGEYLSELATDNERSLVNYYYDNIQDFNEDRCVEVKLDKNTYYITTSYFRLNDSADKQNILLYADVTSLKAFMSSINRIFIVIVLAGAVFAMAYGLMSGKKAIRALDRLNEYVREIAEDKEDRTREDIDYIELNKTADVMEDMADKLKESQEMQKTLFQNASHELRTPLMSIQGYAEGINTNVLKDHKSASAVIIEQSKKMSELVDEMLFLSRMDDESKSVHFVPVNMRDILEYCKEEVYVVAEKKNVVVIESLASGDYIVNGNESQLIKAISNIMANGIRYAESKLTITVKLLEDKLYITISDDGKGINENDLPHIFERFYKGEGGNFGIGLSITKDIIERHGGSISVSNNEGAVFNLEFPLVKTKEDDGSGTVDMSSLEDIEIPNIDEIQ